MTWDELVAEFRRLGGIIENVTLGTGEFGRGLYAIDPAREAVVQTPARLMFPVANVHLQNGDLLAGAGIPEDERRFFDAYQRWFGFSTARDELTLVQRQWHDLPEEIAGTLRTMGVLETPELRFAEPTGQVLLEQYVATRTGVFRGERVFIPMVDLVNHRSASPGYVVTDSVAVRGRFDGEVTVRYNAFDAFACALTYGFAEKSFFANSISIVVDLSGGRQLSVSRNIGMTQPLGADRVPRVTEAGTRIELAFMPLGSPAAPDVPRGLFRALMRPYVPAEQADQIFDGIAHFNRLRFLAFLRILRNYDGPLVAMLEEATMNHLEALSAYVGARAL